MTEAEFRNLIKEFDVPIIADNDYQIGCGLRGNRDWHNTRIIAYDKEFHEVAVASYVEPYWFEMTLGKREFGLYFGAHIKSKDEKIIRNLLNNALQLVEEKRKELKKMQIKAICKEEL